MAIPTCRWRSASGPTGGSSRRAGPGGQLELDGRRALINPGSVGQPRDGDPGSSYLLLDPETATMTWQRVAYDIPAVQAAIRAAGLPSPAGRPPGNGA